MEGLIMIGSAFTAVSMITLLVYLRQKKRGSKLSLDAVSILVYALIVGFFLTSFLCFFLT
ncbi:MAG: hypothetical protein K6T66_06985 [Peptococcaceae bacterium]|nr:hypothetical protein [Peptococcaceae bacterium]